MIEDEKEFFVTIDGQKLYSIQDLIIWLYNCSDESFHYHIDKENHFYYWIKYALKEDELAEKIKDVKDKKELINILEEFENKNYKFKKEDKDEYMAKFIKEYVMK